MNVREKRIIHTLRENGNDKIADLTDWLSLEELEAVHETYNHYKIFNNRDDAYRSFVWLIVNKALLRATVLCEVYEKTDFIARNTLRYVYVDEDENELSSAAIDEITDSILAYTIDELKYQINKLSEGVEGIDKPVQRDIQNWNEIVITLCDYFVERFKILLTEKEVGMKW